VTPLRFAVPAKRQSTLKWLTETTVFRLLPVSVVAVFGVITSNFAPVCAIIIGGCAPSATAAP